MLRYKIDKTWFSRLLQYLVRKWTGARTGLWCCRIQLLLLLSASPL